MTEVTTRPQDYNGHTPDAPPRCPYSRHFSYITGQYYTEIGYDDFTELMDGLIDLWERTETIGTSEVIADGFEAMIDRIRSMREWTGWGGVPGIYTGEVVTVDATRTESDAWGVAER